MKNTKTELVFIPAPAMGHLASIIEFAKRLLDQDQRFSITVLVIDSQFTPSVTIYTQALAASDTRIRFIDLPRVEPPPSDQIPKSPEKFFSDFVESHKPYVKDAIATDVSELAGLVVDVFCTGMIDVAKLFGVPCYLFFPSSAAFLGLMLYLPVRHSRIGTEFSMSDSDSVVGIPSYVHPVPIGVIPSTLFNDQGGYASFVNHATRFKETQGIIVNTFAELEPYAMNSFLVGDGVPPIYAIGPLLDLKSQARSGSERDVIMKWLDEQPLSSVVFLCFGSQGSFTPPQLVEMANGLERSGQRFLWSIRQPPQQDEIAMPSDCGGDYEGILPNGFLKRTEGRGMVCGWAPQVEVLAHRAIGSFVSHCGWNSILESMWNGVPIVTLPIYAEQQLNAFEMVKELGLGVELRVDYRGDPFGVGGNEDDLVTAEEIERAIRCVMDGENVVRQRVREMGEKSRKAVMDGGSSFASCRCFVENMLRNSRGQSD